MLTLQAGITGGITKKAKGFIAIRGYPGMAQNSEGIISLGHHQHAGLQLLGRIPLKSTLIMENGSLIHCGGTATTGVGLENNMFITLMLAMT